MGFLGLIGASLTSYISKWRSPSRSTLLLSLVPFLGVFVFSSVCLYYGISLSQVIAVAVPWALGLLAALRPFTTGL